MELEKYDVFEARMLERFPKMFAVPYGGFCVDEGWWPIIESLCSHIQSHIDWNNQRAEKYPELCYKQVPQVTVAQIKEKFGGLRFYYDGGNDIIAGMVSMAESWAAHSCETCGAPGKSRDGGWIKTLCDHHEQERKKEYEKKL
jgi:hypothetical protein